MCPTVGTGPSTTEANARSDGIGVRLPNGTSASYTDVAGATSALEASMRQPQQQKPPIGTGIRMLGPRLVSVFDDCEYAHHSYFRSPDAKTGLHTIETCAIVAGTTSGLSYQAINNLAARNAVEIRTNLLAHCRPTKLLTAPSVPSVLPKPTSTGGLGGYAEAMYDACEYAHTRAVGGSHEDALTAVFVCGMAQTLIAEPRQQYEAARRAADARVRFGQMVTCSFPQPKPTAQPIVPVTPATTTTPPIPMTALNTKKKAKAKKESSALPSSTVSTMDVRARSLYERLASERPAKPESRLPIEVPKITLPETFMRTFEQASYDRVCPFVAGAQARGQVTFDYALPDDRYHVIAGSTPLDVERFALKLREPMDGGLLTQIVSADDCTDYVAAEASPKWEAVRQHTLTLEGLGTYK